MLHAPEKAFERVLNDEVEDNSQISLLVEIARIWTSLKGSEAFLPLFQALNVEFDGASRDVDRIVENAIGQAPQSAWETLILLDSETQQQIHRSILRVWVAHDPLRAFKAIEQLADETSHRSAQLYVLSIWALVGSLDLLNNAEHLPKAHRETAYCSCCW